jgi:hypothetical protein
MTARSPFPYSGMPARSFWKTGVCEQDWEATSDLYRRKFEITPVSRIMTAGSCFAQHVSRHMRARGFKVLDTEPPPPGLREAEARELGYLLYSARYGNIYTVRQLLQLLLEVSGRIQPANSIWEKGGRYFDALRPSVEPGGLDTPEEVARQRQDHLSRVRQALESTDVFIFTFGLTEAWMHKESGTVYPTAPGLIAGDFDQEAYAFKNFTFVEIFRDFLAFRKLLRTFAPRARILLTVSPVPLTATASGEHVLPATIYSKSVLRAVAGQLASRFSDVDYFPSYEMIATPFLGKTFYDANLRTVRPEGVEFVMRLFFQEHGGNAGPAARPPSDKADGASNVPGGADAAAEDAVCEDILLERYSQ